MWRGLRTSAGSLTGENQLIDLSTYRPHKPRVGNILISYRGTYWLFISLSRATEKISQYTVVECKRNCEVASMV
jgi:hypothetical protein